MSSLEATKGKENTIIILGKQRVGKSNLIHHLTGKPVKVVDQNIHVTTKASSYEGILDDVSFQCIDTRGFCDGFDDKNVKDLKDYLTKEDFVKKIFIVINFHSQDFSNDLIQCFEKISEIFPMPDFWKRIIVCYSHYSDSGFVKKEQRKRDLETSNKKGFEDLMKQINGKNKKIEIIKYEDIKKIYYDLYDDQKAGFKKDIYYREIVENNKKYKEIFNTEIRKIFKETPMYKKIEKEPKGSMKFGIPQKNNPDMIEIKKCNATLYEYYNHKEEKIFSQLIPDEDLSNVDTEEIVDKQKYEKMANACAGLGIGSFLLSMVGTMFFFIPGGQVVTAVAIGGYIASAGASVASLATGIDTAINCDDYEKKINSSIENYESTKNKK